jgi:hypothetical protein
LVPPPSAVAACYPLMIRAAYVSRVVTWSRFLPLACSASQAWSRSQSGRDFQAAPRVIILLPTQQKSQNATLKHLIARESLSHEMRNRILGAKFTVLSALCTLVSCAPYLLSHGPVFEKAHETVGAFGSRIKANWRQWRWFPNKCTIVVVITVDNRCRDGTR